MLTLPRLRLAVLALLLLAATAVTAPAAQAAPTWNCEASPLHARLLGIDLTLGLLTSNAGAPRCQTDSRGLGALTGGLPAGVTAGALSSSTSLTGASGAIASQHPNASAAVADVRVGVTGLPNLLRVDAATSSATASCVAGAPAPTATSTVGNVYLGGVRVVGLDGPVTVTGNVVNGLPTGTVARLVPNEQTLVDGVLTRNALHVTVATLGVSVLDVTVAQSVVSSSGAVCDTTAQQRPTVAVVDSGRNRVVAATVTPPAGRTIAGCAVTAPTRVTGTYDAATGRCTATLPRADVPPGTYDVTVDATDSAGQTGTGTGTVTVAAPAVGSPAVAGRTVTASVAPPAGTMLAKCAFDLTNNGNTTTLDGTYDAGAGVCRATLPDAIPEGPATAVARAVDSGGDVGTASASVTVGAVPPGPAVMLVDSGANRVVVAHVTPGTGRTVTACTLAVRTAGATGTFAALAAQLSGDGTTCTARLPRAGYDPGAYEVRATATDDAGRTGTTTGAVSVSAPGVGAPAADDHALSATLAPAAGTPVTACAFTLTPVGGGDTTTVDGTVDAAGATCAATAPAAVAGGVYTVTATARDANGDTGAAAAELRIGQAAPAATPPTVTLGDSGRNRVVVAAVAPSAGDTITACAIAVRPADDDDYTPLDATYDAARGTCTAMLGTGAFDPGTYDVIATATDSSGDAATDRGTVAVVAPAVGTPAADGRTITATVDPAPGTPLVSCRISVDPAGAEGPTTLSGTLADGTCTATLPDAVGDGEATAQVTVVDANGDAGTTTDPVTIGAVPRPAVQLVDSGDNRTVAADVTPPPGRAIASCAIAVRPAGGDAGAPFTPVDATYDADAGRCAATLPRDAYPVGAYDVRVTATDDAGRTGEATGTATVAAPRVGTPALSDRTVVATATAPAGTVLASCRFTLTPSGGGAATDLDGDLDAATGVCRAAVPDAVAAGDYTVAATVTDASGDAGTASGSGTVGAAPGGPTVALVDSGRNRAVVATVAPGADPDLTACTLRARPAGSTDPYSSLDATLDAGTCTATLDRARFAPGAYDVRATATDAAGRTGTASGTATVAAPAVGSPTAAEREVGAPVVPAPGVAIDACRITLTAVAPGSSPEAFDGRYDAGTSRCVLAVPGAVADGVYTATVTATDAQGDSASATGELRIGRPPVAPTPPTAAFADSGRNRVALARVAAPAGESITACVIRARDDDGDLVALATTYDADAGTCTATLPAATFAPGAHDVEVLVTDSTGDTATATSSLTVAAPSVGTPVLDDRDLDTPITTPAGTAITSCTVTVVPRSGGDATVLNGTIADGACHVRLPDTVPTGPADVTVTVTDGDGDDATGTATVTVPAPGATEGQGGGGSTDTGSGSGSGSGTTSGQGTTTPAPQAPTTPSPAASASVFATGNANDILLACGNGRLLLTDVVTAARQVRIAGVAARALAGRTVTLKFTATGRTVATAKVRADGTFAARAPLPAKKLRTSDRARYQAVIGTVASQKLKLARRTYVTRLVRASGGRVELRGKVTGPRARRAAAVVVQRLVGCNRYEKAATVKLSSKGRFVAKVAAPRDAKAALYRVMTKVPTKAGGRATNRTYSLLGGLEVR